MQTLIQTNVSQLSYLKSVLETVSDLEYSDPLPDSAALFAFTIGQQTRHILDHYLVFQEYFESDRLDYYLRKRSETLEKEKATALQTIAAIISLLESITENKTILVQSEGRIDTQNEFIQSSLAREISFLATHTIHHLAILKIMINFIGKPCHEDTGVAPATLEYLNK